MDLREAWDEQADAWLRWTRTGGHDQFYELLNLPNFLELLPPPGRLTVDIGCGEGRLGRTLAAMGHRVVGFDASPALVRAAAAAGGQAALLADAARLPLREGVADLAVAFMSLQDVDDLKGAVREAGRIVAPSGRLCLAIVHPLNSAGGFTGDDHLGPFVIDGSYLERRPIADTIEREGVRITFHQQHRPLEDYTRALENAGFLLEAVREPVPDDAFVARRPPVVRWRRVPCFLHVRAVRR